MKKILLSVVCCLALVGIACAKSPSVSPSKPASFDPVLYNEPAAEEAAADVAFLLTNYVDNVACEININNSDSYSGSGQTVSSLTGTGCDFYLGDDGTVDATDPDYVSGPPAYMDLPNDNNDLEGTERLVSVSKGTSLNACLRNWANANTETTIIAVYEAGDLEHATGAIGFASASGAGALLGNIDTLTVDRGRGVTTYNYEGNTVASTAGNYWGGFSQAHDNIISITLIDTAATDTTFTLYTNSAKPDVVVDAAHGATAMVNTDSIASTVDFRLSGNASTFNGIRGGRYYYFACVNDLLTPSEVTSVMAALNTEFSIIPSTGDAFDVRLGGWPGSGDELSVNAQDTIPRGADFTSGGDYLVVGGIQGGTIETYTCTTPFDPSSCTSSWSCDVTSTTPNLSGWGINREGSRLYVTGQTNDDINVWNYNPSKTTGGCAADAGNAYDFSGVENTPRGICIAEDEQYILMAGTAAETLYELTCTGTADLTTCSLTNTIDLDGLYGTTYAINDIGCSNDLKTVVAVDATYDQLIQYNMGTLEDASTLAYESQSRLSLGINNQFQGIDWEEENNQLTYTTNTNDLVGRILLD